MKRVSRMLGVTLLEIMLVLAIAAMVIVMSIRYYQSASISQKINSTMATLTAVFAAGENYFNAKATFSGIDNTKIAVFLPQNTGMTTAFGSPITVGNGKATTYTITLTGEDTGVCNQLGALLSSNPQITSAGCVITVSSGYKTATPTQ